MKMDDLGGPVIKETSLWVMDESCGIHSGNLPGLGMVYVKSIVPWPPQNPHVFVWLGVWRKIAPVDRLRRCCRNPFGRPYHCSNHNSMKLCFWPTLTPYHLLIHKPSLCHHYFYGCYGPDRLEDLGKELVELRKNDHHMRQMLDEKVFFWPNPWGDHHSQHMGVIHGDSISIYIYHLKDTNGCFMGFLVMGDPQVTETHFSTKSWSYWLTCMLLGSVPMDCKARNMSTCLFHPFSMALSRKRRSLS